jgi:glycosyltransferase involved in cell wall biosynthesis
MKKLLFIDGTPGFTVDRKDTKACGGILNSLTIIPQYLAKQGWDVTVKCTVPEKIEANGVKYIPYELKEAIPKWDITILNRNGINLPLVNYSHEIGAKVVWWLHDIVDFRYLEDSGYRHADKIIALSNYCCKTFSDFYSIPKEKFGVISNGVDKSVFYPGKYENRKKYSFIMASALIKGFIPIFDTWINLKRHFPKATLTIYSSQSLHDKADNSAQKEWLREMETEGATVQQPIPQHILADKMRECWGVLMPNSYPEICSNLMLQARACGTPVITSSIGSAPEFIEHGKTGLLTSYHPHDLFSWIKEYVELTVQLCKDEKQHKQISEQAPEGTLSWDTIGEKWHELLKELSN